MQRATLCLLFGLLGCSSDPSSGQGSCSTFNPCGGDIAGTWKLVTDCVAGSPSSKSCPDMTIRVTAEGDGALTFNPDGTYGGGATVRAIEDVTVPGSCLGGSTCDALKASFVKQGVWESVSCTGTGSCQCHLTTPAQSAAGSGTYTTSGAALTLKRSDGTSSTRSYCVQGNTLMMQTQNSDGTLTVVSATRS